MKGWRTLLLNVILAIAPVIQATGAGDLGLTGNGAAVYGSVVAFLNILMRLVTTTPMGKK